MITKMEVSTGRARAVHILGLDLIMALTTTKIM